MAEKIEDYSRQLKYLIVLGNEILKEEGVLREGFFFSKLREFVSFYNEIKPQLSQIIEHKKNKLPIMNLDGFQTPLKFVNYQYPALPIFVLMITFSLIATGYYILKSFYVKKTKSKLRLILQSLSSLLFIIENNREGYYTKSSFEKLG